jgi:Bacterial membrane protein YfhO
VPTTAEQSIGIGMPAATVTTRRRMPGPEVWAAMLAALLSMGAYCVASAVHGTYPFGARSRAINDLGNQFIPFHAHLWDVMHGTSGGDLFFNWNSAFGVPFLGDFFTYLTNPFSWLVVLWPRDMVDFPVFLVTLFSIGLGTATMTVFLGRLQPGSPWLRALLATGFGVCAWAIQDGSADPMWMWALVSVPLLGIAADWCLHERRWVLGTLAVSLCWFANFYTAWMATLCAGLVLVVRLLLAEDLEWRHRARILVRAGTMVAAGVALVTPVILVSYKASKAAQPDKGMYKLSKPLQYLAQLIPGVSPVGRAPDLAIGMFGILLVLILPFNRAVRGNVRVAWFALILLVAGSFLWRPTLLAWQGFSLPNGSPYREAFILSALLTMAAWICLAHRPAPAAVLGGAGLLAVLMLATSGTGATRPYVRLYVVGLGLVTLAAVLALHWLRGNHRATRSVGVVLAGAVFGCSSLSIWAINVNRDLQTFFAPHITMNAASKAARAAVTGVPDARRWPHGRADPGPNGFADNDPMLVGGQGGAYYSSYVPAVTAQTLQSLGMGWYIAGRHTLSPTDPVSRMIMGIDSYLQPAAGPHRFTQQASDGAPLVTVHPGGPQPQPASSVFARQEAVLGGQVWQIPQLTPVTRAAAPTATWTGTGWSIPANIKGGPWAALTAHCAYGSDAYVYAPYFSGMVSALGANQELAGNRLTGAAESIRLLGRVGKDGLVRVGFGSGKPQLLPASPIGCLDQRKADAVLTRLRATGATRVTAGGHSISATLPAGSKGTAVIATTAVQGWSCTVDGGASRAPVSYGGLLGVPLGSGASRVSCSYTPPGLKPGLAGTGAGLLALAGVLVVGRLRRRRGDPPSADRPDPTPALQ